MDASQRKRLNALLDMARTGKSPDMGELAVYAVLQLVRIADALNALAIANEERSLVATPPPPIPLPKAETSKKDKQ